MRDGLLAATFLFSFLLPGRPPLRMSDGATLCSPLGIAWVILAPPCGGSCQSIRWGRPCVSCARAMQQQRP
jgi:hypothetical protein